MMPNEPSKNKQTLVEEGTEFKGTLKSSCPIVVNGIIDGEVDAPEITVTRSGAVLGTLKATRVRSQGTLSGKVEAADVFLSGAVKSNTSIKAKRLEVKVGSEKGQIEVTFGECNIEVGDTPAEEATAFALSSSASDTAAPVREATTADGWAALDSDSGSTAQTPSSPGASSNPRGSSWKASRVIEASSISIDKTTLR
jgi:cytoskeletal protein CcmA (bactofilin family)